MPIAYMGQQSVNAALVVLLLVSDPGPRFFSGVGTTVLSWPTITYLPTPVSLGVYIEEVAFI